MEAFAPSLCPCPLHIQLGPSQVPAPTQWTQLGKNLCLHQEPSVFCLTREQRQPLSLWCASPHVEVVPRQGSQLNGITRVWHVRVPGLCPAPQTKEDGLRCFQVRLAETATLYLLWETVSDRPHLDDQLQIIHVPLFCLNQLVNVALPLPLHGLHCVQGLEIGTPCRDRAELNDTTSVPQGRWTFLRGGTASKGHFPESITRLRRAGMRDYCAPGGTVITFVKLWHALDF